MKLSTLLSGIETQSVFEDVEIERVTDKDKDVIKNTLFVCIDGNRLDGHLIAKDVIKKGAVAVLTERDLGLNNQIIVSDTRKALAIVSSNFYNNPSKEIKLIGITGTNGKTSTAFFIRDILENLNKKCGLIGTVVNSFDNQNNDSELTTPEPIELHKILRQMVDSGCEYCVMEVSSQALSQSRVWGLKFCASVITNITPEHLDYHGNMQNYTDAKLKITELSDFCIINIDDDILKDCIDRIKCPKVTVSAIVSDADYIAKNIEYSYENTKYIFVGIDCIDRINIKIPGRFTVYNSLCAVSVLLKLGYDLQEISTATTKINPVKGRAEKVNTKNGVNVFIDYAHTPDGISNILTCLREVTNGKIITVFGCGGDRDKSKRPVMGKIVGNLSDVAVVTTDNPRTENTLLIINDILKGMEKVPSQIVVIENRKEAIEYALSKAKKGDTVLLAGKGHETYQIIGKAKNHFDEREIIKKYYKT